MLNDVTFGQYYEGNSFLHKMNAGVKLLLCLLYLVGIFFVTSFAGFALITVFLIVVIALSGVPVSGVFRSVRGVLFLLFLSALLNLFFTKSGTLLWQWWIFEIYDDGIVTAIKMLLRLTYLIIGSNILTLTTTPVDLTHAIEVGLKPLSVIGFPAHELALIMSLTLSFIPGLIDETNRIIRAQKARGADFDTGNLAKRARAFVPILIPLLVGGFRRADELANAMNSRCYEGAANRTRMKKSQIGYRDFIGAFVTLLVFVAVFVVYANAERWAGITWLYY